MPMFSKMLDDCQLTTVYNEKVLFPFVGLVRERKASTGIGETALIQKPSKLTVLNFQPQILRVVLTKYMECIRHRLALEKVRNFKTLVTIATD